jgi:hypothetical protein
MRTSAKKPVSRLQPEDVEAIIKQVKNGSGFVASKNPEVNALHSVISKLNFNPYKIAEAPDFDRVKNQILDRISIPAEIKSGTGWFASLMPRALKVSAGIIGSILIVVSLTLGTAVAALESIPGQPIYPLKKIVENIRLNMASDEEKAVLQVKFADNRLEELEKVLEQSKQGKLSEEETQKIVADTVKNLTDTTAGAVSATQNTKSTQPKVALLTKLVEQSALLQSAAIESEGETKIEIEKALEASKISQEEAIANIERAGLKVEATPITVEEKSEVSEVTAHGKLTAINETSVSVGTARFLITKTTKFINTTFAELEVGQTVDIKGEVDGKTTYAMEISIEAKIETPTQEAPTEEETQ